MSRLALILPLGALLALEVYHCARRNGRRFAAVFFISAFLFGIIRGNVVGLSTWLCDDPRPYGFSQPYINLGFTSLMEPLGWAFALYGSWFIAEGLLRKTRRWQGEILPVAFLSALFMGGFSYAVEAAATPMDWWHWRIAAVSDLFIYAVPVAGVMDWASVAVDFLTPFLLFQCPSVRKSRWRFALPLIFVAHVLTHLFPSKVGEFGKIFEIWHYLAIYGLGIVALFVPLKFVPPQGRTAPLSLWASEARDRLDLIPFISVASMLVIVLYALLSASGDPWLLFSALPLAVGLLIVCPRVPILPVAFLLVAATAFEPYFLPAMLPAALLLLYEVLLKDSGKPRGPLAVGLIVVVGLLAYGPWALWTSNRNDEVSILADKCRPEVRAPWSETAVHCRALYTRVAKFAGGETILSGLLDSAWQERDRETFLFAAKELRTIGPRFEGVGSLWDNKDLATFRRALKEMRESAAG